ncbi:hypothetical protein KJ359_003912 [Pestalotiopsis sp. 9143b]|nr:hypothetical protein KJ359_003912 [Pestalotiopsis sp. 9143b]
MLTQWLWLALPILVLARPNASPEDCEEPEGSNGFGASPFTGGFHGPKSPSQNSEDGYLNEVQSDGPGYSANSPNYSSEGPDYSSGSAGYDKPGSPSPWEGDKDEGVPGFDSPFEPGPVVPSFESPEYFPNTPPPWPYSAFTTTIITTSTLTATSQPTTTPTTTSTTSTTTSQPATTVTDFLLLASGSAVVPDGTSLSDELDSATGGIAVFDNGNGVFTLDDNRNLVDVATGNIANIADASGLNQPLQFSPGADIDTDGNIACVCEITSDLVLFCDCGNGYVYFVTGTLQAGDANILMLSQTPGPNATDPTDSPVTVIVQNVS